MAKSNSKSPNSAYNFLDNFYPCTFTIDHIEYHSAEHYYQSQRAKNMHIRKLIREAKTSTEAKKLARSLATKEIVKDWNAKKTKVMKRAILAKFKQNKPLLDKLLETKEAILHEDSPDDLFWGVKGKDMQGKLLMDVRKELNKLTVQGRIK